MSAAETMREAAKALRERAGAATPGPWEADVGEVSQHWSRPEPWQPVASGEVACMAYCYGGSARGIDRDEDADYIAMMSPPVALALADWLDSTAHDIEHVHSAAWTLTSTAIHRANRVAEEILEGAS